MKTNLAILGTGRWGKHLIRNFLGIDRAQIQAIADPNCDRLQQAAQQFNLSPSLCLTPDWQVALDQPNLQAVVVAIPAEQHFEVIQAALNRGYHVLTEKPITLSPEEAARLCQLATAQQRCLVVDHTYRFHPAVKAGAAFLQNQPLGNLRYGYASRTHLGPVRQDVDALWDLAIHDLVIFNYWLGSFPIAVRAWGQVWLQPQPRLPYFPEGLADRVWATLAYPQGLEVQLHLCWLNPDKQRRLVLVGDRGSLIFDELAEAPLQVQWGQFQTTAADAFTPTGQHLESLAVPPGEPLAQVCHHFLDCVEQNQPSALADGHQGKQLITVLTALSHSLHHQGAWTPIP